MTDAPEAAPVAPKAASAIEPTETDTTQFGSLAIVPPLTLLAAVGIFFDLCLRRGFLRTGTTFASKADLLVVEPYGRFAATLAGLAALIALCFAVAPLILRSDVLALSRRAGIALFTAFFVACLLVATFMPIARTPLPIVYVGTLAGDTLALSLGLLAFEWRAPLGIRVVCATAALAGLGAFLIAVMGIAPPSDWPGYDSLVATTKSVGELAFLLTPVALAATFLSEARGRTLPLRIATSVGLVVLGSVAFVLARAKLGADYETVLFGALRLSTFVHTSSLPYALVAGMTLATAFFGLSSRSPIDRQLGAAVALQFAAGFSPRSLVQLAAFVLAAALFGRAVVASTLRARAERASP